ncbi:MAG: GNAT family N-acetyltransferase [Flavobacteriaceae bacterium]
MKTEIKTFDELTNIELYDLLRLRAEVFIVEQDCVYQDLDGRDQKAIHVLGKENQNLLAYARVFKGGDYFEEASIGRIVVAQSGRSFGFGKEIVKASEKAIKEAYDETKIKLSAQSYLQNFYSEMGYKATGTEYLEDGIPHINMVKKL